MTPVAVLVAFCLGMAAVAVWRLATDDERDPVDIGSVLVVVGITLLTAVWAAVAHSVLSATVLALLALVGVGIGGAGVAVMVRYWDRPPARNAACD